MRFNAQDLLEKAGMPGIIRLEGQDDDNYCTGLVENIIKVITEETTADQLRREVELLADIHNCTRKDEESSSNIAVRFNGTLARYNNQSFVFL